jgi:hypothetical protein
MNSSNINILQLLIIDTSHMVCFNAVRYGLDVERDARKTGQSQGVTIIFLVTIPAYATMSLFNMMMMIIIFLFTLLQAIFFQRLSPKNLSPTLCYKKPVLDCQLPLFFPLYFYFHILILLLHMKRRNSIAEFSFQLSAVPTHYCPSDSGSIYNITAPEASVCYLRQPDEEEKHVPEESSNRVTPQPLAKRFPSRSLSDSVLVLKDKNCAAKPTSIIPSWKPQSTDEKPPYSYATLIAYAILSSPDQKLPLNDIYLSISANFPYYVLGDNGWQVRLCLLLCYFNARNEIFPNNEVISVYLEFHQAQLVIEQIIHQAGP